MIKQRTSPVSEPASSAARSTPPALRVPRRPWMAVPVIAGFAYVLSWVAGLAVFPVNLALDAHSSEIVSAYTAYPTLGSLQFVLVEGVACLLLGLVLAVYFVMWHARVNFVALPGVAASAIAVLISVIQCVLGLIMISGLDGPPQATSALFDAVNRLDGVKFLALAFLVAYLAIQRRQRRFLPNWLRIVGGLLALTLFASAISYLFLVESGAWAVYVSGPLLLLWVAGVGIWLSSAARSLARDRRAI